LPYDGAVAKGATVTWSNDDSAAHTVTSGTPSDGHDGLFDSGLFMSGSDYEFTFEDAGTYDYFCMVHPWMIGFVNVE
jgi:plastocyanin